MRRSTVRPTLFALTALVAGCGGIRHTNVVSPQYAAQGRFDTAKLGEITSQRVANGKIYLGARKGIASLDENGKVLWQMELPAATVRLVDADAQNVAYTSYDVVGIDESTGAKAFFLGKLGDEPQYANAVVGLATEAGQPVWQVKSGSQTALSAPALSPVSVGVARGASFAVFQRGNGAEVSTPVTSTSIVESVIKGMVAQALRNRPLVTKDAFFSGFFAYLSKVDFNGKSLWQETNFGLFSPFENITVGPFAIKDKVVFGTSHSGGNAPAVFGATTKPSKDFKEFVKDKESDLGSIVVVGDHFFVATNFMVTRFQDDGDKDWEVTNNGGGLYPGGFRGVRYAANFPTRKSHGDQMAANEKFLYVTSVIDSKDVLTVLDANKGTYVETINIGKPIVEIGIIGQKLAVASFDGVDFIPLK